MPCGNAPPNLTGTSMIGGRHDVQPSRLGHASCPTATRAPIPLLNCAHFLPSSIPDR